MRSSTTTASAMLAKSLVSLSRNMYAIKFEDGDRIKRRVDVIEVVISLEEFARLGRRENGIWEIFEKSWIAV